MILKLANALDVKRRRGESDKGFTLIELLVVVLIIGILAAIAIPVFLNQRQGAWRSAVESDIRNAALAAETYAGSNNGSYANLDRQRLLNNGYRPTANVALNVAPTSNNTGYVISAYNLSAPTVADTQRWFSSSGGGISTATIAGVTVTATNTAGTPQ